MLDPGGKIAATLQRCKVNCKKIDRLDESLGGSGLLIVGPDALRAAGFDAWGRLTSFVAAGGRALVLEQDGKMPEKGLPLPLATMKAEGSTAFPHGAHPALEAVGHDDLCIWAGDQAVCRWPFTRSEHWPLLVDGSTKDGMNLAPVVELPWGKGHMVLCQLLVGEKIQDEPMAEQMLSRLAHYLANLPAKRARLTMFASKEKETAFAFLARDLKLSGTSTTLRSGANFKLDAAFQGDADVVLLPGTRSVLNELTGQAKAIQSFAAGGGWIVIQDIDSKSTGLLSKIVGEELIYRPVGQSRITVSRPEDPLMAGIGNHEFYWDVAMNDATATKEHVALRRPPAARRRAERRDRR